MAASFNARGLAREIAKGLTSLNSAKLRKYSLAELRSMLNSLTAAQREIRAQAIPPGDTAKVKEKNRQLQNITQAINIINGYIKKHGSRF